MKTQYIIAFLFCSIFSNYSKGQTVLNQIINALSKEADSQQSEKLTAKDVVKQTIIVNSSSNARISGGKTREVVKVNLPIGTKKWFYRITILDVNSPYTYQSNESFYYLINNKKYFETYDPTGESVDFYILGHSGDMESFRVTGNNNFKSFSSYTKLGTRSFVGECNLNQENLWIGIKNPNAMVGLKVMVEVVSWGNY